MIISREFIVSGFRLIASDKGIVLAAGMSGKIKTVLQMMMTIVLIMDLPGLELVEQIFIYAALFMTVYSLADYLYHNQSVLKDE